MNNYLYSEGTMKTTINNQVIDDKSYKFEYDGDIGKGVVQNNKDSYYVELDDNDFEMKNILRNSLLNLLMDPTKPHSDSNPFIRTQKQALLFLQNKIASYKHSSKLFPTKFIVVASELKYLILLIFCIGVLFGTKIVTGTSNLSAIYVTP